MSRKLSRMANGDHSTPRWVKLLAIVVAVLAVLLVVSLLAGVDHGPGRHA